MTRRSPVSLSASFNVACCQPRASRAPTIGLAACIAAALVLLIGHASHATPIANAGGQFATYPFAAIVTEAARQSDLPASWIRAVMQAESSGDARAVSPKGAMGLMQIMPETWDVLRLRYGLGADPFDPRDNIFAGAVYLKELHDRYGSPGFLAAYNAGPARYQDHLATGQPLPDETRAYVAMLAPLIGGGGVDDNIMVAMAARSWTDASLFIVRPYNPAAASRMKIDRPSTDAGMQDLKALAPQSDGLFVRTSRRISQP